MFFGFAIAIIVFGFVIRVAFSAFIIAAVMSIIYAIYRRVKDFVTYDRYGEHYIPKRQYQPNMQRQAYQEVEPLFYEQAQRQTMKSKAQFVEIN
ncbi:MAG: hypothetical protein ACJAUH_002287 [Saprospiraceae bacterium]|jgi:hypothetical protein|tara:strand:+ start:166 stop:447 length:282 start_codon:yes stop_codon:yes gene_type:complete